MVASAGPYGSIDLASDLRMVKAALLYGDHAVLYSPAASMLVTLVLAGDLPLSEQLRFWERVLPAVTKDETQRHAMVQGIRKYRKLLRKKHPNPNQLRLIQELAGVLTWEGIREVAGNFAETPSARELDQAADSGMLTIHVFSEQEQADMVRSFLNCVGQAVTDDSAYPLFDAGTGGLVRAAIDDGMVSISGAGITRGRSTGLAGHLFSRLPLFESALVDEVLDVRRELERPLVRFRSAMMRFSAQVSSAAWDEDFPAEADLVYHRDAAPAVCEIEEAVESNRYLRSLTQRAASKSLALPAASLAVILSELSKLPDAMRDTVVTTSGLGAAALGSAKLAYDAYEEWKQKNAALQGNQLYFYYQAERRFSQP